MTEPRPASGGRERHLKRAVRAAEAWLGAYLRILARITHEARGGRAGSAAGAYNSH